MLEADKWVLCDIEDSLFHMNGEDGFYNVKFVSICGKYEAVYNKAGELLTAENDALNMGTYNYYSYLKNDKVHGIYDVIPYVFFGNTLNSWGVHKVSAENVEKDIKAMEYRNDIITDLEQRKMK